jgi:ribonuclease HI
MQLSCIVYKSLQPYHEQHPLHKTNILLTALAHTPDTSHMNVIHAYKSILQQCDIQSPILGQPLITHHFQPTNTVPTMHAPTGWLTTTPTHPPNTLHAPANLPPAVLQTLQQATTFAGEVAYVDGSEKDGHAGSSYYFPHSCLGGKQRVTGIQTSGRGEINAILGAIDAAQPSVPLMILSDCYGVVRRCKTLQQMPDAERSSIMCRWKNRDLWYTLKDKIRPDIRIEWIPGHSSIPGNELADQLANEARQLPIQQCTWQKELWRLYYKGSYDGTELVHHLMGYIPSTRPTQAGRQRPQLIWDGINFHLSFCNLGERGHITRFQWLWGRTSWLGVAPWWEYKDKKLCKACNTTTHELDLFSSAALCPKWEPIRSIFFNLWESHRPSVRDWFSSASEVDKRHFIRSLIPTSLVHHLRLTVQPPAIQTLVNCRDNHWNKGVTNARSIHNPSLYTVPDDTVPDNINPQQDSDDEPS